MVAALTALPQIPPTGEGCKAIFVPVVAALTALPQIPPTGEGCKAIFVPAAWTFGPT